MARITLTIEGDDPVDVRNILAGMLGTSLAVLADSQARAHYKQAYDRHLDENGPDIDDMAGVAAVDDGATDGPAAAVEQPKRRGRPPKAAAASAAPVADPVVENVADSHAAVEAHGNSPASTVDDVPPPPKVEEPAKVADKPKGPVPDFLKDAAPKVEEPAAAVPQAATAPSHTDAELQNLCVALTDGNQAGFDICKNLIAAAGVKRIPDLTDPAKRHTLFEALTEQVAARNAKPSASSF